MTSDHPKPNGTRRAPSHPAPALGRDRRLQTTIAPLISIALAWCAGLALAGCLAPRLDEAALQAQVNADGATTADGAVKTTGKGDSTSEDVSGPTNDGGAHPDGSTTSAADSAVTDSAVTDSEAAEDVGAELGDVSTADGGSDSSAVTDTDVTADTQLLADTAPAADVPDATVNDTSTDAGPTLCLSTCDDGVSCTVDTCDTSIGVCAYAPNHGRCDDKNPCTVDTCSVVMGCTHAPFGGSCGTGKVCDGGSCIAVQGGFVMQGGFQSVGDAAAGAFRMMNAGWLADRTCSATHCMQGGFAP